ncbi:HNH endonuclease [Variovorax dokdonensis]|uniref:HNH endonuclease n=1 Tax=Variovorax dokdonensis TaxID=344883 RepID=A0ABT7NCP3_9BURK|nr:HNH endonuclease [Variovorax dokdonensis]MDM0045698.1 HNH endonuclease [Variovorax dokdonensis]
MWQGNKANSRTVHRLVAQTYISNPDNKPVVNHIDANRANPHRDNLEWVTQSENLRHAYRLGTMSAKRTLSYAQLNECLARFLAGESMTRLSGEFKHALGRLSINLRNLAVEMGVVDQFTKELIRQKNWRNKEANRGKQTPVLQLDLDGRVVAEHCSLTAAAASLGKDTSGPISNVLRRRQRSAYGFLWKLG